MRLLAGRYELSDRIGSGGMGEVWRGWDRVLHRTVAVKVLPGFAADIQAADRLEREARAAARISDDHVVTVHDYGRDGDTVYVVMELADGRALDAVLREEGLLSLAQAVDWTRQVCLALAAAHAKGVVHRDIKPANVMIGSGGKVKVVDFGIAWFDPALGLERLSRSHAVLGSAPWMSPEQARGRSVDHRSDLYSVGCLLHQLLTGQTPFGQRDALGHLVAHAMEAPDRPSARRAGIPDELDRLVLDLLAKEPGGRPASALDVADRLQRIGAGLNSIPDSERVAVQPRQGAQQLPVSREGSGTVGLTAGGDADAPATAPPDPDTAEHPQPVPPAAHTVKRRTLLVGALVTVVTGGVVAVTVLRDPPDGGGTDGKGSKGPVQPSPGATSAPAQVIWQKPAKGLPLPVARCGKAVLADGEKALHAVDIGSGRELWAFPDAPEDKEHDWTISAAGVLYTSSEGRVNQVEAVSGKNQWSYTLPLGDDSISASGSASLRFSADGKTLYAAMADLVVALNPATGGALWTWKSPKTPINGLYAPSDKIILIRAMANVDNMLYALSPITREVVWQGSVDRVEVHNGQVFTTGYNQGSAMSVLNIADGTVRWEAKGTLDLYFPAAKTGVYADYPTEGTLTGISLDTGKTVWTQTGYDNPAAVGTRLIAGVRGDSAGAGMVTAAFDPRDGHILWKARGTFPVRTLQPEDGAGLDTPRWILATTGIQGGFAALAPETGEITWTASFPGEYIHRASQDKESGTVFVVTGKSMTYEKDPADTDSLYAVRLLH
ncbi:protein kinase domain-containing protein [Streptomyces sp. YS-3]|uniref:serine/threonine-protein kinase n=1 Tax=Streptomyces sp. YS-3 TaxID=3381352 RepID=UPI00386268C5